MIKKILIVAVLSTIAVRANSQSCDPQWHKPSSPTRYVMSGATIIDQQAHLEWQRCVAGQAWNDLQQTCSGAPLPMTKRAAATFLAKLSIGSQMPYRLPTSDEISQSIIAVGCLNPAIDLKLFPNSPMDAIWTSDVTKADDESDEVSADQLGPMLINFHDGASNYGHRSASSKGLVRGVRTIP